MLSLLCSAAPSCGLTVAGLAVRLVRPLERSPWILEVDLMGSDAGAAELGKHDALASTFWPASVPLARVLSSMPGLKAARVVELGCGTGLCSLLAASRGAAEVLATDIEPVSLELVEAARDAQVGEHPGLAALRTMRFDMMSPEPLPAAQLLIVSDLFVTSELARAVAGRVADAVEAGAVALVVDPGRSSRDAFMRALEARRGDVTAPAAFEAEEVLRQRMDGLAKRAEDGAATLPAAGLYLCDTAEGAPLDYSI